MRPQSLRLAKTATEWELRVSCEAGCPDPLSLVGDHDAVTALANDHGHDHTEATGHPTLISLSLHHYGRFESKVSAV